VNPEAGTPALQILDALLRAQPSVRLVTDRHLAAIAIENGLEPCSRDRDSARWSDLGLDHATHCGRAGPPSGSDSS
jgi:hypothetical protein